MDNGGGGGGTPTAKRDDTVTKRGSANTDFSDDVTAKPTIADNGGGGGGTPTAKSNDTTAGADSTKAKKTADQQRTRRKTRRKPKDDAG